ncbi:hypothetical protein F5B22DRAFT_635175 [Xylaria bambusicola]|uniref:uncharacterized protein n=1 Tax=Xylaria bambusicola TaxID=326684 RepID=UPI0020083D59|nr:uncharacterized protein F5B22DRAFT_635175 [Xylaria bambusicola]KAI0518466.1 hypothetical protein F5B22DRAFT_635175 [Xylaria bambusicola]
MNNDLSLSRALGGLRIANPDDATPSPPQPHSIDSDLSTPGQPSTDIFTPDTQLHKTQSVPQSSEPVRTGVGSVEPEATNQSTYNQNGSLPYSNISSRPVSALYNVVPTASVRDQAANSYHILRTESSRPSAHNESGRTAPEYSANLPSRESSHRDRSYNQNRQAQLPSAPEPRGRGLGPDIPGSTGSEEWKDRGAAVGMRKEVDANGVRDFSFGRVLGEGSYSSVYLATDRQTLKEYAVKVLEKRHIIKERKIKYVNIEKDTLNRLTEHPGIVRLYYTFQDENSLYYVLDICSGGELLGVLKKTGTFDVECTRFFGAQILDAIEYMHSRGVIHRDLKPENVLLDDQLHVKITDFGTARLLSDPRAPQTPSRIEDTGTSSRGKEQDDSRAASFVGTAEYVSPELLTNKNACKASDLWAFGCIIYQMLAGRPPFKGGSEYLTFQKIVNLDYEFPPGFPSAARDLVERLLVLDPARRLTIEHIKNHEFFDGQQFGKILWKTKAPRPYNKGEEGHRKFTRFFGGSTTKKRQRLVMITSSGRIILAPAGGEEKKAKQDISLLTPDCSWKTQIDAKGQVVWCVDSAGYHWTFEDIKTPSSLDTSGPTPDDWIETLQQAKDIVASTNMSGSYVSDNAFGEISSSMSSPASTFGPEGYSLQQHHQPSLHQQRVSQPGGPRRGGIGPMMSSGPHHSVALSQAQIVKQQQEAAMQFEHAKRRSRKPTDKNLPDGIDNCIVGDVAKNYRELRDFERRLDATMTRKRLDIVDAVTRSAKRWKTLRIWITNTAENQIWQGNGLNVDTFDFNSNLEPTYRVKIEARLLDDDDDRNSDDPEDTKDGADDPDRMEEDGPSDSKAKTPKPPRYRFSHFFKALHVDFPHSRGGAEQGVEWKKPERVGGSPNLPAAADFDELTFKRNGDENLNITINLIRHEEPERYALSRELEDIVDMREATRQEIVMGLWEYIKMMGLQEDEEKRNFRCDELLRNAFGGIEMGAIPKLTDYISPHLQPLPPVQLPYTIRLDEEFHKDPQPTIYDVRVAVDDPLREQMTAFLNNAGYAGMLKEVSSLDEKLAIIVQAIHVSKAKHNFLESLSEDPATFVRNWLSSQKRDLDVILGEAVRGGGEDANGDEWRKGGKDSIWGTVNARESVNSLLSRMPTQPQR